MYGEMHRYIPVIAKWAGFDKIGEKVVLHQARKYGSSKFGISRFTVSYTHLVQSGVKDVREAIEKAKSQRFFNQPGPVLFIDEIHRFSKSQQDSLLGAVEKGIITLIGATTENPSFEVISALLSRCQVYVLQPLSLSLIHI